MWRLLRIPGPVEYGHWGPADRAFWDCRDAQPKGESIVRRQSSKPANRWVLVGQVVRAITIVAALCLFLALAVTAVTIALVEAAWRQRSHSGASVQPR